MSYSAARQAIVDTLETKLGLSTSPTVPAGPIAANTAWVVRVRGDWQNACARLQTFYVFVSLPAGLEASSAEVADALAVEVGEALWTIPARVTTDEDWQFQVEPGAQAIPCLRFTVEI